MSVMLISQSQNGTRYDEVWRMLIGLPIDSWQLFASLLGRSPVGEVILAVLLGPSNDSPNGTKTPANCSRMSHNSQETESMSHTWSAVCTFWQ